MPAISLQAVLLAVAAAVITAIGSIAVAFITTRKHSTDISSSLMNEALDLVSALRTERVELREELASLRTEIVKCRQEIAQLREENSKLQLALAAHGGTIDTIVATKLPDTTEPAPPRATPTRRRTTRNQH